MTQEQQRIKIAEACGWKRHPLQMNKNFWIHFPSEKQARDDSDLPDYLNDLNAMHDVEIDYIIPNGLWDDYVTHLKNLMKDGKRFWGQATAGQRAEAFLRTLNRWKE